MTHTLVLVNSDGTIEVHQGDGSWNGCERFCVARRCGGADRHVFERTYKILMAEGPTGENQWVGVETYR